jgi:hypothetical protein
MGHKLRCVKSLRNREFPREIRMAHPHFQRGAKIRSRGPVALDFFWRQVSTEVAPAGLASDHQQALLSLIANVTQQMPICSRSFSTSAPLRGLI